jgi:hypothetical protein
MADHPANLKVGVDWMAPHDDFTREERDAVVSWYNRYHGDGNLDLAAFVPFWVDNDPGVFRRFKRWVESQHDHPGRLSSAATQLILMHNYTIIGYQQGALYELIGARMTGASKAQVLEALSFAWLQTGPPGMTPVAEICMDYVKDWTDEPPADQARLWPEGWSPDPSAFASGLDFSVQGITESEITSLKDWYLRNFGEIPQYVGYLAEHNPDGLKAYRARYEFSARGALPKQMFPLCSFFTAAYHANPRAMRWAAHQALLLGATKEHISALVCLVMVYAADLNMDTVVSAVAEFR